MINDRLTKSICEQIVSKNQSSQGRSHDHSDYYRILLAFGLVYNKSQAFAWLFNLIGRKKNMIKAHWIILYLFVCLLAIAIPHWI